MFEQEIISPIDLALFFLFQMFLPLLEKSVAASKISELSTSKAAVLNLTSMVGSIQKTGVEFVQDLGVPGYKISKVCVYFK